MDIRAIKAFCNVADSGSFSRAGARLGAPQSLLSRQVAALEKTLGHRLFHRTGRGVHATEFGQGLLARAKALLAEVDRFEVEARDGKDRPIGAVDLGVVSGWTLPIVTTLVRRLRTDFPQIMLRVHEAYSGQVESWIANGQVDIGVFNRYRSAAVRGADVVMHSEMMLVGPKNHPLCAKEEVAFAELAGLPLCGPLQPNALISTVQELAARRRFELNVVLEVNSAAAMRQAVIRCGLCAVVSRRIVERNLVGPHFSATRIVKPKLLQTTWLAQGTQRPPTRATATVLKLVRDILAGCDVLS